MMKLRLLTLFIVTFAINAFCSPVPVYRYTAAIKPWPEHFGNHRAVIAVDRPSKAVMLDFWWRRHDKEVDKHCLLIVNASTGDTVRNILRKEINAERCRLVFGPVAKAGTYYFYYLPYKVYDGGGNFPYDYIKQEKAPDSKWVDDLKSVSSVTSRVVGVESRSEFDSFFPMELIATASEQAKYIKTYNEHYFLFPENRRYPIRMRDCVPERWMNLRQNATFVGNAAPDEYYAFQIGVWAFKDGVQGVSYRTKGLRCGPAMIPSSAITCFNTEGVDSYGKSFTRTVDVKKGTVQALWFGVDIPSNIKTGIYKGTIEITDASGGCRAVPVSIRIEGKPIAERGDNEPWRHSRLRWLNSTLGIADTPIAPYTPMVLQGNVVGCLGRDVSVNETTALPEQINSWNTDLLAGPVRFVIETAAGVKHLSGSLDDVERTDGHVSGVWRAEDNDLTVEARARMEFDGRMNYIYTVTAKHAVQVKDIRLELSVLNEAAPCMVGAGLPGQLMPKYYEASWSAPRRLVDATGSEWSADKLHWEWPPFDSFWIGGAQAGIHCELRGASYTGPMLNIYHPAAPESWSNGGLGGFRVQRDSTTTLVTIFSGKRELESDKPVTFDFAFIVTPIKKVDYHAQFTNRYYHDPSMSDEMLRSGVKIINIHHANRLNPFINYPFLSVDTLSNFVKKWHSKDCKVKIYYTVRELTSATTEIWVLRSLGHEVLGGGQGGGFPWLREHFIDDYTPQWYQHFDSPMPGGIVADAAVLTSGNSRWYNYYVEGLHWLVKHINIDGLYLDDVAYDRRILQRIRRAMASVKPGCIIDLHSNTGFSKCPANQYAEFFPYIDKLWFGESFQYDEMSPENWLVECSGIPFGLTGDMLNKGGNRWLGMQYGMTNRLPWFTEGVQCDPRDVWRVWDDFGIADANVFGWWDKKPAVVASDSEVKVTAYLRGNEVLLSVGNYGTTDKQVRLTIDRSLLGLGDGAFRLVAKDVPLFQKAAQWSLDSFLPVPSKKGWLLRIVPDK